MAFDYYIGKFLKGEGITSALDHVAEPVARWATDELAVNRRAFSVGGHQEHGGLRWAPWSANYSKVARARGQTHVLVHTGALRESLTREVWNDSRGIVVSVGTDVWYAPFHQHGSDNLPARTVVTITEPDNRYRNSLVKSHLEIAINGRPV